MSLIVYPYQRNPTTNAIESTPIKPNEPHNDLFGFEFWRSKVWGSSTINNLGCTILFSLKHQDIYVENETLHQLKKEIELVKDNITIVSEELKTDSSAIELRLNNALEAIRIAIINKNYGVYID